MHNDTFSKAHAIQNGFWLLSNLHRDLNSRGFWLEAINPYICTPESDWETSMPTEVKEF